MEKTGLTYSQIKHGTVGIYTSPKIFQLLDSKEAANTFRSMAMVNALISVTSTNLKMITCIFKP